MGAVNNLSTNGMGTAGDASQMPRHDRGSEMTDMMTDVSPPIRFVPSSLGFRFPSQIYSDDADSIQKRPLSQWTKSKTRRFWLATGLSLALIIIIAIVLPLYLVNRPHGMPSGVQNDQTGSISHSFLVDITSTDDEATRAKYRQKILTHLDNSGAKYTISRVISSPVYNGFRITVDDDDKISKLESLSDVLNVWPVQLHSRPQIRLDTVQNPSVSSNTASFGDIPFYPPHSMTGVDQLHNEGLFGKGVKIGIIDTGVDFLHPALGGCFGTGCTIAGGIDLAGDAFNGTNTPVLGNVPFDNCNGHGTHVSGIIAADARNANASLPFVGVAPEVSIFMYRIFGCNGSTTDDLILDAMTRAFDDNVDIISMSLGGVNGWSEDPASVVADRLVQHGIFLSIAAGNDGANGALDPDSPGSATDVTSVASVDNTALLGFHALAGQNQTFTYLSSSAFAPAGPLPIYITAKSDADLVADACQPLPPDTPDLSKFVVLTKRGTCLFKTKIANLEAAGAKLIFIDNTATGTLLEIGGDKIAQIAILTLSTGQFLRSNPNLTISFPANPSGEYINNTSSGGFMSTFTSWGPTNELDFSPRIAAPGGNIYSTFPEALGGFAVLSGTSMATPYITGVVALYLSVYGPTDPLKVRSLLGTTGTPVDFNNGTVTTQDLRAPVPQQGGGLVNAVKFIKSTTEVSPAFIALNVYPIVNTSDGQDTTNFQGTQTISVTNTGKNPVVYSLGSISAGTVYVLDGQSEQPAPFPPPIDSSTQVSISLQPEILELAPGTSGNFTATFVLSNITNPELVPIYSGYIIVASSAPEDGGALHIPFQGVATSMLTLPIFNTTDGLPSLTSAANPPNDTITSDGTVFTMNDTDIPAVNFGLFFPTRVFRLDVLPGDPNAPGNSTVAGLNIVGSVAGTPFVNGLPRTTGDISNPNDFDVFAWNGTFSDGSMVPNGQYRLGARVLKMLAPDLDDPNSWETYISPVFTVQASSS